MVQMTHKLLTGVVLCGGRRILKELSQVILPTVLIFSSTLQDVQVYMVHLLQ